MGDSKADLKNSKSIYELINQRKYLILTLLVLVILILFLLLFRVFNFMENNLPQQEKICGDGTLYSNCSDTKPYFCSEGKLIDLASFCGCPDNFVRRNDSCISVYQTEPKEIYLNYVLRGENYSFDFTVYGGFANYISKVPHSILYSSKDNSSRADFKIKVINEGEQKKLLMPLVIKIQNMTLDKEDQARIAISVVQNIPFGASNKTSSFGKYEINYSRYPYEVLYDMGGICGEKTDLLAFLLKEIGYGTAFFYYPSENHEAVGLKCPVKESLIKSGYCFVETTAPSIITDNKISYAGLGKLSSNPEVYLISEGESIGNNLYEYSDANKLIRIRSSIERNGWLGPLREKTFEKLKEKYGLAQTYYG
jgi:hypothetical protein